MKNFKYLFLCGVLLMATAIEAQNILSKTDAVGLMLQSNYNIQLANNNEIVAQNSAAKNNFGYLPSVNFNTGGNFNFNNSTATFITGQEVSSGYAESWNMNAGVVANYTIYDGNTRHMNYQRALKNLSLSSLQKRQTIEQNLLQVLQGYYQVAQLKGMLDVTVKNLEIDYARLERAEHKFEYGQGSKLEILNAEVDINRDSITHKNTVQQLNNAKRNLNFLLGRDVDTNFDVDTIVVFSSGLIFNGLLQDATTKNINVLLNQENVSLSQLNLNITQATKQPRVTSTLGYNWSYNKNNPASQVTESTGNGLNAGVQLSWNIFDGGLRNNNIQNAQIGVLNQQLNQEQMLLNVRLSLNNAWEIYQNNLYVLQAEQANIITSQRNFETTKERFNAGQVTSVEFRQAQLNMLNAQLNYINARYTAKNAELQLLQLSGNLIDGEY